VTVVVVAILNRSSQQLNGRKLRCPMSACEE
jgi:hypothetical protein